MWIRAISGRYCERSFFNLIAQNEITRYRACGSSSQPHMHMKKSPFCDCQVGFAERHRAAEWQNIAHRPDEYWWGEMSRAATQTVWHFVTSSALMEMGSPPPNLDVGHLHFCPRRESFCGGETHICLSNGGQASLCQSAPPHRPVAAPTSHKRQKNNPKKIKLPQKPSD